MFGAELRRCAKQSGRNQADQLVQRWTLPATTDTTDRPRRPVTNEADAVSAMPLGAPAQLVNERAGGLPGRQ